MQYFGWSLPSGAVLGGVVVDRRFPGVTLTLFTPDWLPRVRPWFSNPEVRHRLGGRDWPERELRLMRAKPGIRYRGRRVLRCHSWVGLDAAGEPVGKIGGDVYDRWTRWDGSNLDRPVVTAVVSGPAMGLTYVVDPGRWREGYGAALVRAVLGHSEVADARVFVAGIDADNAASRRCVEACGFTLDRDEPDWQDTVYYLFRR